MNVVDIRISHFENYLENNNRVYTTRSLQEQEKKSRSFEMIVIVMADKAANRMVVV